MPSRKGAGRVEGQLPLPSAPRLDGYGMHAYECECARCVLGYRPTARERDAARYAAERAAAARKKAAAEAAAPATREVNGAKTTARLRAQVAETEEMLRKMAAPVARPTDEQWAELRAERRRLFGPRRA